MPFFVWLPTFFSSMGFIIWDSLSDALSSISPCLVDSQNTMFINSQHFLVLYLSSKTRQKLKSPNFDSSAIFSHIFNVQWDWKKTLYLISVLCFDFKQYFFGFSFIQVLLWSFEIINNYKYRLNGFELKEDRKMTKATVFSIYLVFLYFLRNRHLFLLIFDFLFSFHFNQYFHF